jgi:hypothetical protein
MLFALRNIGTMNPSPFSGGNNFQSSPIHIFNNLI